jgi:hypothetical protein
MNYFNKYIYTVIVIALLFTGISACQNSQQENSSQTSQSIKAGSQTDNSADAKNNYVAELVTSMNMHYFDKPVKAPEFELESVKGGRVSLSQHRGNVVLLSFWATW